VLVVVTGAGGRIGSAASAALAEAGFDVRALVREEDAASVPGTVAEIVVGEVADPAIVRRAVDGAGAVVHLAAIPTPQGEAVDVFTNNVTATFTVLDLAARAGVGRLLLASSISALGLAWAEGPRSPDYVPVDEEHPLRPEECYALSKQVDEQTGAMLARRYGATVLAYRFPFTASAADIAARAARVAGDPSEGSRELWAYLDVRDAAGALVRGVEASLDAGFNALNVVAPDTLSPLPSAELVARFHPGAEVRAELRGRQSLYSRSRAERLIGFHAEHLTNA
jgi:nucleoside-diphosphate-sugar epimerase